jgi:hypothetical protein
MGLWSIQIVSNLARTPGQTLRGIRIGISDFINCIVFLLCDYMLLL